MMIFLDESGDLGWSFDKPFLEGGSSRFVTIAGILLEKSQMKFLSPYVVELCNRHNLNPHLEIKGSKILNSDAVSIVNDLHSFSKDLPLQILSITADKRNVPERLYRDKSIFYNHLLNNLLSSYLSKYDSLEIILDDRTTKSGSRNSFQDCLRAKCWGELQLNTNISCRFEESHKNSGIWLADWLANFIWRHYENHISDPYFQCLSYNHFHEIRFFT